MHLPPSVADCCDADWWLWLCAGADLGRAGSRDLSYAAISARKLSSRSSICFKRLTSGGATPLLAGMEVEGMKAKLYESGVVL